MDENYQVIYRDTDSIFVLMKNCPFEKCFEKGEMIASYITHCLKNPIELKFEKIYQPFFINSKKKYCGMRYTNPKQNKGIFDCCWVIT